MLSGLLRRWWKPLAIAGAGVAALFLASHVVADGIDAQQLAAQLLGDRSNWLLALYDRIGGGALHRGSLMAIGAMPYLTARLWVAVARVVSPTLARWLSNEARTNRVQQMSRLLTLALAAVQSYGFTQFVQSLPNVVSTPGWQFALRTTLVLTGGALATMFVTEALARVASDIVHGEEAIDEHDTASAAHRSILAHESPLPQLNAPSVPMPMTDAFTPPEPIYVEDR